MVHWGIVPSLLNVVLTMESPVEECPLRSVGKILGILNSSNGQVDRASCPAGAVSMRESSRSFNGTKSSGLGMRCTMVAVFGAY